MRLRTKIKITFVVLFMIFWVTGMTAAITGGRCRDHDYSADRRIMSCNISVTLGDLFPGEGPKRSTLYLERGIVLAEIGREDDAQTEMIHAIERAAPRISDARLLEYAGRADHPEPESLAPDYWLLGLFAEIDAEGASSPARKAWDDAIAEITRPRKYN